MSNEGPRTPREQAITDLDLTERDKKILSMGDSLQSSWDKVMFEKRIDHMQHNLNAIGGANGWQEIESLLPEFNDEDRSAIEKSSQILKSLAAMENKDEIVKRATRNMTDLATARKALRVYYGDDRRRSSRALHSLSGAVDHLFEAAGSLATPEEMAEAYKILGLMDEKQLQEAKERASKMKVT